MREKSNGGFPAGPGARMAFEPDWESQPPDEEFAPLFGRVRVRTLVLLRWMAVAGQTLTVLFVQFGLGFDLPLTACLFFIGLSALVNVYVAMSRRLQHLASHREAFLQLAFDVIQLCILLALTGGLSNPFAIMLVAPVTIGVASLPRRWTLALAGVAITGGLIVYVLHMPLPWRPGEQVLLPPVYVTGLAVAVFIAIAFTGLYAWRMGREAQRMGAALAATQGVLAREQRLGALGALAAAAAHELGTPLATIQLTAKEMARALREGDLKEDAELLVSQAQRCREILKRLSEEREQADVVHDRLTLLDALKEAASPLRGLGSSVEVRIAPPEGESAEDQPVLSRRAEFLYALGNFIENAVGFAQSHVLVEGRWTRDTVEVIVADDGPGFAAEILSKIGEPYISSRREAGKAGGHGLGLFISMTLIDRLGGEVKVENGGELGGASVTARWPRIRVEAGTDLV